MFQQDLEKIVDFYKTGLIADDDWFIYVKATIAIHEIYNRIEIEDLSNMLEKILKMNEEEFITYYDHLNGKFNDDNQIQKILENKIIEYKKENDELLNSNKNLKEALNDNNSSTKELIASLEQRNIDLTSLVKDLKNEIAKLKKDMSDQSDVKQLKNTIELLTKKNNTNMAENKASILKLVKEITQLKKKGV